MNIAKDLIFLSQTEAFEERIHQLANQFEYSLEKITNPDTLIDNPDLSEEIYYRLAVLDTTNLNSHYEIGGLLQVFKQMIKTNFIVCIVNKRLDEEGLRQVRLSGANVILFENEFYDTSKLEFISTQTIKTFYLPVKAEEFSSGQKLDFTLYHLIAHRGKFLPVVSPNDPITDYKAEKMKEVGEIYILKTEAHKYSDFLSKTLVKNSGSISRAKYLSLYSSYVELVLVLLDQTQYLSFEEGRNLNEKCKTLAKEFIDSLSKVDDPWRVVNNSALGDFGSIERTLAIASYAGLMGINPKIDLDELIFGALFMDLGLILMPPKITYKIRNREKLSGEDMFDYIKHPLISLNLLLQKRINLTDSLKAIIACSHENVCQTGFPNKVLTHKVSLEAELLRFCQELDQNTIIIPGESRKNLTQEREKLLTGLMDRRDYSFSLINILRNNKKVA